METPDKTSMWERSSIRRALGWLFSWRGIRRMLILFAWTLTLIALLYGEENCRGRRRWNHYRQELESHGAQLDFKAFIPKEIPDEQNFAATPFVQSWFLQRTNESWNDAYSALSSKIPSSHHLDKKGLRRFTDLVAWQMTREAMAAGNLKATERYEPKLDPESRAKAAPAVLEVLQPSTGKFEELREASRRPRTRYPVVYDLDNPWGILLPHLARVKAACARLELRACAELAAGQSDKALEDVKLMFHVGDSIKEEVFLISYLVRAACLKIAIQPIWEGLAEHRWSDAQLQEFQKQLEQYNFLTEISSPLAAERAAGVLTAELLYRQKYHLSMLFDQGQSNPSASGIADFFGRIAPHGWYLQEQYNFCRLHENQLGGTFDPVQRRVFPAQIEMHARELEKEVAGGWLGNGPNAVLHHKLLATMLLPALGHIAFKAAAAQTATDQALLACALERYRLAHGQFPEDLQSIRPQFLNRLPNDLFAGQPYKYRRTNDGQFLLYSIGRDEKDDDGTPGKTLFDEKGDWVWNSN